MYSIANKNYLPSSRHHIILNIICNFISFSGFFEEEFDDYGSFGGGNMGGGGGGFNMRNRRPRYISKTGHSVYMQGLPFQAIEQDVFDVSFLKCFIIIYLIF